MQKFKIKSTEPRSFLAGACGSLFVCLGIFLGAFFRLLSLMTGTANICMCAARNTHTHTHRRKHTHTATRTYKFA